MTEPVEKPRSWLPLIVAGSLALLVIAGVIVTHLVRADLSPEKQAAVTACEAAYKQQLPNGPGFVGGDVYAASEWRDLNETMVSLGYLSEEQATLTGEEADAEDARAAALISKGADRMTIVWQRDDQSHATCVADMQGGKVTATTVTELSDPKKEDDE